MIRIALADTLGINYVTAFWNDPAGAPTEPQEMSKW